MMMDHSEGWEAIADQFMAIRSSIGTALIRSWAKSHLPSSPAILDIGCGSGLPISQALARDGYEVWGIDASPKLITAYRSNLPGMPAACEAAQSSRFFNRTFAGAIAVGLIFLLNEEDQGKLLAHVGQALDSGGRFLFSAPLETCEWKDTLTGRTSISLGVDAYAAHLRKVGLTLMQCLSDEGGNNYFDVSNPI